MTQANGLKAGDAAILHLSLESGPRFDAEVRIVEILEGGTEAKITIESIREQFGFSIRRERGDQIIVNLDNLTKPRSPRSKK